MPFLNAILSASQRMGNRMDANETYNSELDREKRGYLYDIMTNPNYGFTNDTRIGAGQNLGFRVAMPKSPAEQMYRVNPETFNMFGTQPIDRQGNLMTEVPGSVLSNMYSKDTPMTQSWIEHQKFVQTPETRYDAPQYIANALERSDQARNRWGLGSIDWNRYKVSEVQSPDTYLTRFQGKEPMSSQDTNAAKNPAARIGSGQAIPKTSKATNIILVDKEGKQKTWRLEYGVQPIFEQLEATMKLAETMSLIGKTVEDPITGKPIKIVTDNDRIEYLNNLRSAASEIRTKLNTIDPKIGMAVLNEDIYNRAMGLQAALNSLTDPNDTTTPVAPKSWYEIPRKGVGGIVQNIFSDPDSNAILPDGSTITKTPGNNPKITYKGITYTKQEFTNQFPDLARTLGMY